MRAILAITNGNEFDCEVTRVRQVVDFSIEASHETIYENFADGSLATLKYDGKEVDITKYRIMVGIHDNLNGEITVSYRELSDLEKLIELHYGGVN